MSTPGNLPTLTQAMLSLGDKIADPDYKDLPEEELPGLPQLINDWHSDAGVSEEDFYRRLLGVFKNSTHSEHYDDEMSRLDPSHREAIEAFVGGERSIDDISNVGKEIFHMKDHKETISVAAVKEPPSFIRGHVKSDYEFKNWGETVSFTPALTFYPRNTAEIQSIVQHSIENKQGVRVAGFRHSWSPIFGRNNKPSQKDNGDVLISMLPEYVAGKLPNFTALPSCFGQPAETELSHIGFVEAGFVNGKPLDNGRRYVRVGAATTNEQFRRWCCGPGAVTLPANIVMVEISMGGANAPICHGAGIQHQTLSDRVRCIEYVDANGKLGKVDMSTPKLMKTASGCFGLLGVVTHITYECDAISTAVMNPVKQDVMRAIPPPPDMPDSAIPEPLRLKLTPEERRKDQEEFERRANNDYYAEWFWFPFSSKIWVNCWSTDSNTKDVVTWPSNTKTTLEVLGLIGLNLAQNIMKKIQGFSHFPMQQTMFLSWIEMKNMLDVGPGDKPVRTLLPNALHFSRGIQNLRVRDLEVEFPLSLKKGSQQRDYYNVQKSWWDAIILCYEHKDTCPQRMPLEMRIMGDSEVTMAPQRGHTHGTCSIEILTLAGAADQWQPYATKVLNKWMSLKDADGKLLTVRPHWAKEWQNYTVNNGTPWPVVLKNEVYPEAIKEFKEDLREISKKQGLDLGDLQRMFSNELLDFLFFDGVLSTEEHVSSHHHIKDSLHHAIEEGKHFVQDIKHEVEVIAKEVVDFVEGK